MYRFGRILVYPWVYLLRRLQVEGRENIPKAGGCILAANHKSFWDPVIVGVVCPRPINFMAKKFLFDKPILGWLLRHIRVFPVNPEIADRNAIRTALQLLEKQEIVGIFPEGTRNDQEQLLLPPMNGTAMMALKTGVPIIPIALSNTKGFCGQVRVKIGSPLLPNNGEAAQVSYKEQLTQLSSNIMQELARLLQEIEKAK